MYLHAIATAVPERRITQRDCWQIAAASRVRERLSPRSLVLLQRVLTSDNGIEARHLALPVGDALLDLGADQLNAAFRTHAPALAGEALARALAEAGLAPAQLDALLVCTCTGYLCPGVSSYVAEQLGLRADVFLQDLVGLGCGAAIPTLRAAQGVLAAQPGARVAVIAVEVCSAAFYLDDDPGVLVSACLFGDGAAACILGGEPPAEAAGNGARPRLRFHGFDTEHWPAERDVLRFEQRDGRLRNILKLSVPEHVARAVSVLWARRGERPVAEVLAHGGGRDVVLGLERVLGGRELAVTRAVLRDHGNMSSPSVLFALERAWRRDATPAGRGAPPPGADWWLVSFGAGFAAHACRVAGAG